MRIEAFRNQNKSAVVVVVAGVVVGVVCWALFRCFAMGR
jgi:hypothetical protein